MTFVTANKHPIFRELAKAWGKEHNENDLVLYVYDLNREQFNKLTRLDVLGTHDA